MSEEEAMLLAASRGWRAEVDYVHRGELVKALFLKRAGRTHTLQPLKALLIWDEPTFLSYLDQLEQPS